MPNFKDHQTKLSLRQFFTTQTWWGKIIGAIMGYLMAGPAGALFGILVGNLFDRGLAQHFAHPYWHYHSEKREQIQKKFFEATFEVMGHMAKIDGRVSEQEIKLASSLMQEMKLNSKQKRQARELFRKGKSAEFDLKKELSELRITLQENPELLKLFVEIQYRAAQTDSLSANKLEAMNTILRYLGFAPLHEQYRFYEDFDYKPYTNHSREYTHSNHSSSKSYRQHQPRNSLTHAFAILEVSPNANKQEVKKAYRRLMSKNHPDKLIAQGLPEEMIRLANDKTQKISKAYEQICASKGW
ncbi:co-chaperone DjlA [Legionella impletisoli]|uniref:Co-chaperone protein DjlA n=1 Tax=Legionella impletisoli TaxID=343510 RepID=A0A917JV70_9GAMM|nr:co-chaperone DjlA [Legionella impletisoli]GGI86127.1 co-chaperone protein DjlA [Legionella impletisoli]